MSKTFKERPGISKIFILNTFCKYAVDILALLSVSNPACLTAEIQDAGSVELLIHKRPARVRTGRVQAESSAVFSASGKIPAAARNLVNSKAHFNQPTAHFL